MSITRKVHAHGELFWWLILLGLATALTGVLAREARGTRVGGLVSVALVHEHAEPSWDNE